MQPPSSFQQQTIWNALTGLAILMIGVLLVGLIWLIGQVFGFLQPVLIPLLVAGIIAYVLEPVVTILEKRHLSRLWSVISVYLAMLVTITLLIAAIIPGIQQGHQALKELIKPEPPSVSAPTSESSRKKQLSTQEQDKALINALLNELTGLRNRYENTPISWLLTETNDEGQSLQHDPAIHHPVTIQTLGQTRVGRFLFEYKGAIFKTTREWVSAGSSKIFGFLGLVIGMIMVPIYLFFFLKDSSSIREHWHDYVPLKASHFKTELVDTLQEINRYLVSFFRGQVLVAMIDGVLVGIALTIFGLPYGFLIGIFMAILGVIPYIGNILCLIPACIIAWLHAQGDTHFLDLSPWAYVACVIGIFIIVQQINSLITAPKIVGDSVGLHPLTVIFSMLFWSLVLGGFIGGLLAVPMTAAVKVLFRRFIWARQLQPD